MLYYVVYIDMSCLHLIEEYRPAEVAIHFEMIPCMYFESLKISPKAAAEVCYGHSMDADTTLDDNDALDPPAGIPLSEVEFVQEYWHNVFERFVADCARGLTPNPDLDCNKHIKVRMLLRGRSRRCGKLSSSVARATCCLYLSEKGAGINGRASRRYTSLCVRSCRNVAISSMPVT